MICVCMYVCMYEHESAALMDLRQGWIDAAGGRFAFRLRHEVESFLQGAALHVRSIYVQRQCDLDVLIFLHLILPTFQPHTVVTLCIATCMYVCMYVCM